MATKLKRGDKPASESPDTDTTPASQRATWLAVADPFVSTVQQRPLITLVDNLSTPTTSA